MENKIITREDVNYLTQQSTDNLNIILSGMTALIVDTNNKVAMLENQTWYQRMSKTISGKNKMTQQEIVNNHDRLNLYMSQAMTELFNQNCIDHEIMISLGNQMNNIYAEQVQLKQMLGGFVSKLNEKIVSIDNFHMLNTEIEQGVYSNYDLITAIFMVLSQLDARTLEDTRKMSIIERSLQSQNIISNKQESIYIHFQKLLNISMAEIGRIYLELGTMRGNFIADMFLAIIESYYFLPDMERKIKNKNAIIQSVMKENQIDNDIELSVFDIYKELLNEKLNRSQNVIDVVKISIEEAEKKFLDYELDEAEEMLLALAEQENGRAMYYLALLYSEQPKLDIAKAKKYFKEGYNKGDELASARWLQLDEGEVDLDNLSDEEYDAIDNKVYELAEAGNVFAIYEQSRSHLLEYEPQIYLDDKVLRNLPDLNKKFFIEDIKRTINKEFWISIVEIGESNSFELHCILFDILENKKILSKVKKMAETGNGVACFILYEYYIFESAMFISFENLADNDVAINYRQKAENWLEKAITYNYLPAMLSRAEDSNCSFSRAIKLAQRVYELTNNKSLKGKALLCMADRYKNKHDFEKMKYYYIKGINEYDNAACAMQLSMYYIGELEGAENVEYDYYLADEYIQVAIKLGAEPWEEVLSKFGYTEADIPEIRCS